VSEYVLTDASMKQKLDGFITNGTVFRNDNEWIESRWLIKFLLEWLEQTVRSEQGMRRQEFTVHNKIRELENYEQSHIM